MRIARIYYPVTTLGYGKRVGIWFSGCDKNCDGCMSDSLRDRNVGMELDIHTVIRQIKGIKEPIDGFTISGGEPFLQADALVDLSEKLAEIHDDIIVYTGYTREWLEENLPEQTRKILGTISVLVDGPYIKELDDGIGIRGSANQKVHVLKYEERHKAMDAAERKVQIIHHKKGITLIGLP